VVNEIQSGRYNAILHKLLSMKEGAPAPTLAPELLAAVVLESDRPEWEFLAGGRLCGGAGTAALAGTVGTVKVFNPVGSGILAVVYAATGSVDDTAAAQGSSINWALSANAQSFNANGFYRDSRLYPSLSVVGPVTACTIRNSTVVPAEEVVLFTDQAAAPATAGSAYTVARLPGPVVLSPGFGLSFQWGTAFTATIRCGFFWTERALDPSETR